jgi:hypothetical protein
MKKKNERIENSVPSLEIVQTIIDSMFAELPFEIYCSISNDSEEKKL